MAVLLLPRTPPRGLLLPGDAAPESARPRRLALVPALLVLQLGADLDSLAPLGLALLLLASQAPQRQAEQRRKGEPQPLGQRLAQRLAQAHAVHRRCRRER